MALSGVSHISLTVTDLARSGQWYHEVLGWEEKMNGRSETTTFVYGTLPDGLAIVLRAHDVPGVDTFDERNVGMDHLSMVATDAGDLSSVERHLQSLGAEYTPVQQLPYGQVLNFRDPDNIALELAYSP